MFMFQSEQIIKLRFWLKTNLADSRQISVHWSII